MTRVLYERPDTYAYGGGGGIRTPETLASLTVFKTAAFNHSATPPPHKHCTSGNAVAHFCRTFADNVR